MTNFSLMFPVFWDYADHLRRRKNMVIAKLLIPTVKVFIDWLPQFNTHFITALSVKIKIVNKPPNVFSVVMPSLRPLYPCGKICLMLPVSCL